MKTINQLFIIFLLLFVFSLKAQKLNYAEKSYYEIRERYENKIENDGTALPFVKTYLSKAKSEKNHNKIFQGYQDAVFYSVDKKDKLKYADSCVNYSLQSKDNELISNAYLEKGVIFYFFLSNISPL